MIKRTSGLYFQNVSWTEPLLPASMATTPIQDTMFSFLLFPNEMYATQGVHKMIN